MASEKINVEIKADYDDREAKQALKDAEKLDGTEAVVTIDAESDEAVRSIREVDEALEDVPSKADKVAAAIVEMANKIDAETRDAAAAADMLKVALGDAAERIDASEAVAELRKMGLTADEVRADVDQLADALKHADELELSRAKGELDTLGTAAGTTKAKVGELRDTGDQSRSVLANMAGNAAQDLGAVGGVVGSLGVGIGQLAEYATEGNIKLSNLAAVAGPMAALSAGLILVQGAAAKIAKEDAFKADQVKAYAKAVNDLGPGLQAVEQRLADISDVDLAEDTVGPLSQAGRIVVTLAEDLGAALTPAESLGTEITNMAAVLGSLGVNYQDVARLISGGTEALDDFEDQLENTAEAEGLTGDVMTFLRGQQEAYAASIGVTVEQLGNQEDVQRSAADAAAFYGSNLEGINEALTVQQKALINLPLAWDSITEAMLQGETRTGGFKNVWNQMLDALDIDDDELAVQSWEHLQNRVGSVADAIVDAAGAADDGADSHQAAADALQAEADAANNAADALSEQANAQRRAVDAYYNLRDARQAQVDAIEAVKTAESEHGAESVEYRESLEDLTSAVDDTAQAEVRLAQEQAESEDATLSAVDAIDIQNSALIRQASQLRGPSRAAIVQHIAALNGIPPEVISEILALLDQGKVDEAEAKIEDLSEPRDLEIKAQVNRAAAAVAEAAINALTAPEDVPIIAELHHQNFDQQMRNLLAVQRFANIVARFVPGGTSATQAAAGGRSAPAEATNVTNVTIHAPRGTRPEDMVRAGDRYARRNGHARAYRR